VGCGLTGIQDLRTNKQDDRMESFALSETLKVNSETQPPRCFSYHFGRQYLFLLFDEENPIHRDDSNYVFTTEGHILTLGNAHLKPVSSARRKMRTAESHRCRSYLPLIGAYDGQGNRTGLVGGIRSRGDVDYARELVALLPEGVDKDAWSPNGWCEMPKVDLVVRFRASHPYIALTD
jgi:Glycosyl hydrolase family 47.